jgi:hypothetical protein
MDLSAQQEALVSMAELDGQRREQEEEEQRRLEEERQRREEEERQRIMAERLRQEEERRRAEEAERAMRDLKGGFAAVGKAPPGAGLAQLGQSGGGDEAMRTPAAAAPVSDLDKVVFRQQSTLPDLDKVVMRKPPSTLAEVGMAPAAAPVAKPAGGGGGMGGLRPRVDIATAMAVAADAKRLGTTIDEQYRQRGYAVGNQGDSMEQLGQNMEKNLALRVAQGDAGAVNKLLQMNPGESLQNILAGQTRSKMQARMIEDQRQEKEFARTMESRRLNEASAAQQAQRAHEEALLNRRLSAEDARFNRSMTADEAKESRLSQYQANELKIKEKQVNAEISGREAQLLQARNAQAFAQEEAKANRDAAKASITRTETGRTRDMEIAASLDDAAAQGGSKLDALRKVTGGGGLEKLGQESPLPMTKELRAQMMLDFQKVRRGDMQQLQRVLDKYGIYVAPGSKDAQTVGNYLRGQGYMVNAGG